jgi:hypothetical protein
MIPEIELMRAAELAHAAANVKFFWIPVFVFAFGYPLWVCWANWKLHRARLMKAAAWRAEQMRKRELCAARIKLNNRARTLYLRRELAETSREKAALN